MLNLLRASIRANERKIKRSKQIELRKHLNADAIFHGLCAGFGKIKDHRNQNAVISLSDVLMSAFAMFSLKDPTASGFSCKSITY